MIQLTTEQRRFLAAERKRVTRYTKTTKWQCTCGRTLYYRRLKNREKPDALVCMVCCRVVATQLDLFGNEP